MNKYEIALTEIDLSKKYILVIRREDGELVTEEECARLKFMIDKFVSDPAPILILRDVFLAME